MDIEYSERNIRLFEKFLKPVTISDLDNYEKYFYNYKDDIKGFLEKECNIYISIWYNETHRGKIWFYLVECRNEYYTSDEQYQNDLSKIAYGKQAVFRISWKCQRFWKTLSSRN